jgi:MFS family permease
MQREEETERDVDDRLVDLDLEAEPDDGFAAPAADTEAADRSRGRLGGLFSVRVFLVALLLSVVAVVAGGAIPLLGFVGRLGGLFAVAFGVGLVGSRRHYVEVGLAGALASGLGFVASTLTSAFFPFAVRLLSEYGIAIAGVGAGVGALAALVGHYVGRDLRDGLTREL